MSCSVWNDTSYYVDSHHRLIDFDPSFSMWMIYFVVFDGDDHDSHHDLPTTILLDGNSDFGRGSYRSVSVHRIDNGDRPVRIAEDGGEAEAGEARSYYTEAEEGEVVVEDSEDDALRGEENLESLTPHPHNASG